MVQATGGTPADGAPQVPAPPLVPSFPPVPPVEVAQVPQVFVDPKAQFYADPSQIHPDVSGQFYPDTASQHYPAVSSASYVASTSQVYPAATCHMHTEVTSQQPFVSSMPHLYGDVSTQHYSVPSPQPYMDSAPPAFPVTAAPVYSDATSQSYYPNTAAQGFADVPPQVPSDLACQAFNSSTPYVYPNTVPQVYPGVSQMTPFSAPEHYAPAVDSFQQSAVYDTPAVANSFPPTYSSYGPVGTAPSTGLDSADVISSYSITPACSDLIPGYNTTSTSTALDKDNPFEIVSTTPVLSSDMIPEYNPTSTSTVLDNSCPFDTTGTTSDMTVLDNSNPFELVSKTSDEVVLDNSSPFDVISSGNSTFQVIPVAGVNDYNNTLGSDMQNGVVVSSTSVSSDSLESAKSDGTDTSAISDVYMNSDYTDTITSVSSTALLIDVVKYKEDTEIAATNEDHQDTASTESSETTATEVFYSNEAFHEPASSAPLLVTEGQSEDSTNDNEAEPEAERAKEEDGHYQWVLAHNTAVVDVTDSQSVAQELMEEVAETDRILHEAPDCVEDLVHQLAEQHPGDVVALQVEVLDQPVYQPLTEPIWEEEEGWMNSQESLNQYHQYKIIKQGRQGAMFNPNEHKSFLNITAASVTSLGNVCQKALGYVRADMEFGSIVSLGLGEAASKLPSLLSIGSSQAPAGWEALTSDVKKVIPEPAVRSARHMRNLVLVSFIATILLISLNATRNLQSSLNQEGGVGITSLAVSFAAFTLGSLISPVVVQKLGVRRSIIFGLLLQLAYVASNLHPVMWLMAPVSAGGGISLAIIWNAVSTYIVMLARGEAAYREKQYERVSDKYFGIFCLIYQCNLVVGNLIASLILTFGNSGEVDGTAVLLGNGTLFNTSANVLNNSHHLDGLIVPASYIASNESATPVPLGSEVGGFGLELGLTSSTNASFDASVESHYHLCGSNFCHHFDINQAASAVSASTKYLLFGIFMFLIVLAILIAVFLLEPLCLNLAAMACNPWRQVKRQVVSLARFSRNTRFLLLLPLLFYSNMQFSFVCSEVMMAFVTCPVGVWLVGYSMMVYGVACGISSYLTQALVPRTGRTFFIATASAINLSLLLFMRLWQPHPDTLAPLFIITGLFGFADGIWNVNANGLMGSVFPEHYEEAFTGLRVAQGLGGALTMAYAPFLCMAVKIYIMLGCTVLLFTCYLGADFLIKRDRRKEMPTLFEKDVV